MVLDSQGVWKLLKWEVLLGTLRKVLEKLLKNLPRMVVEVETVAVLVPSQILPKSAARYVSLRPMYVIFWRL